MKTKELKMTPDQKKELSELKKMYSRYFTTDYHIEVKKVIDGIGAHVLVEWDSGVDLNIREYRFFAKKKCSKEIRIIASMMPQGSPSWECASAVDLLECCDEIKEYGKKIKIFMKRSNALTKGLGENWNAFYEEHFWPLRRDALDKI